MDRGMPVCSEETYMTKSNGEMGEPWGVPARTATKESGAPWKRRRHVLSVRKGRTQEVMYLGACLRESMPAKVGSSTLSKPPLISRKRVEAASLALWAALTSWWRVATASKVHRLGRNPH